MDNWGEGVVPACREERPQSIEELPLPDVERPASVPINIQTSQHFDLAQRPSRSSSVNSSIHSMTQTKQRSRTESNHRPNTNEQSASDNDDDQALARKESLIKKGISQLSVAQKPYNHDILVIQNQPTKVSHRRRKEKQ
ncbi:unnamed protein product [Rotaria magnacalcarata]|uniref:Uncharacterized protein n=1 Tax=Rotaria magnacalcarata TaxID=392030 RepID=A0A8S3JZ08_9BILA|nr:unnamed protein product [Rotaria magnacalcarata]